MPGGQGKDFCHVVRVVAALMALAMGSSRGVGQQATEDRVKGPGWWPTKSVPSRADFIGPAACAECHPAQAETQPATPMAHASAPGTADVPGIRFPLKFQSGPYTYEISRAAAGARYSLRNGPAELAGPLDWAFGMGKVGETYLLVRNGEYYESRVSYFSAPQGLDFTIGHPRTPPASLEDGLGRYLPSFEAKLCFGCHSTAAIIDNRLQPGELIPGVTCEACHGPGARHVAAMKAGKLDEKQIFNPAGLKAVDSVDFCGACHRTWWDVMFMGSVGSINVRFQPFRLEKSRCWKESGRDARLACVSCHDPHQQLVRDEASYDPKCLACHGPASASTGAAQAKAHPCPVATRDCVKCHMPKVEPPEAHFAFTDHRIRIARPGEPYSD
ncbi:MAG: multiheme c-type cytochrome [Terriglobia bacterium]